MNQPSEITLKILQNRSMLQVEKKSSLKIWMYFDEETALQTQIQSLSYMYKKYSQYTHTLVRKRTHTNKKLPRHHRLQKALDRWHCGQKLTNMIWVILPSISIRKATSLSSEVTEEHGSIRQLVFTNTVFSLRRYLTTSLNPPSVVRLTKTRTQSASDFITTRVELGKNRNLFVCWRIFMKYLPGMAKWINIKWKQSRNVRKLFRPR